MKSYRIILAALFLIFLSTGLKAQIFTGGSIGLGLSGGKSDNGAEVTDKPSHFYFEFSPEIGKFLSEKVAAGISLNLNYTRINNNSEIESLNMSSAYGVTPFLRYYAIKAGKFSAFGQANLGFSYSSSKSKNGAITTDGPKTSKLSFDIYPGLAFDVNEKLSLETYINVLNLGYSLETAVNGDNRSTSSGFNLGGGLDNIATIGNIRIGAIYKF